MPIPGHSKSKFGWQILLLAGTITGLVGVVCLFSSASREEKSAAAGDHASASMTAKAGAWGFAFQPGDELLYDFTSRGTLTMGAADTAAPGTVLQISETGRLSVKVYSATTTGWLAGLAWQKVTLTLENSEGTQNLTPPDLATTEIFVTLDKSGRIAQVQAPYSLTSEARNSWRDILAKWQVILPPNAVKKWTRVEEDATGTFVAQYSAAEDISKSKTHYLRINGTNAALAAAYQVNGTAQIQFHNFPRIITGEEQVKIGGIQGLPLTNSVGDYAFTLISSTNHGGLPPPNLANYAAMTMAVEYSAVAAPSEDNGSLADNLRDLHDTIHNGKFGGPEEVQAAAKIIALLKNDPALTDQLLDELRSENASVQLASALLGVLGAAGTPAAQYDLLAVATAGDWPPDFRQMALYSLVQVAEPVAEADAALRGLFTQGGDLSGSALLVLAAIGDKVRTSDPARFQQINDYVANVLNSPGLSLNDFIVALDAMGNLGPTEVPEAVAKATQNESELIRAKAIASLSRITTVTALTLVMNAIANDPSGDVQAAAVKTLAAMKGAGAVTDLSTIAANGKSVAARKEALTQLSNLGGDNPAIANALASAAQSDPSPDVREYASKLRGN